MGDREEETKVGSPSVLPDCLDAVVQDVRKFGFQAERFLGL